MHGKALQSKYTDKYPFFFSEIKPMHKQCVQCNLDYPDSLLPKQCTYAHA